ncbi:MAG TPA: hypothetical protein VLB68_04710, partial [Pyrinomonadaceae bacterium]|nr:hypothetical protein [Pyrinomonadaceae bacterium]
MPEQFALEQSGRNGRAIELHEGAIFATTMIVNRTRDQFLSRSSLAEQQHRGITGRDCLDQLQDLPQCGTVADDLIEVHLAANL